MLQSKRVRGLVRGNKRERGIPPVERDGAVAEQVVGEHDRRVIADVLTVVVLGAARFSAQPGRSCACSSR